MKVSCPRILIMGISGMLGSSLYSFLDAQCAYEVYGTARREFNNSTSKYFPTNKHKIINFDIDDIKDLDDIFDAIKPNIVINCIGMVKQIETSDGGISQIKLNALFPHKLYRVCQRSYARLIHFSTDCVFSGARGMYTESDLPDARDMYGLSKLLGEVVGENCITLRTSIIGHELCTAHSLIDWFLSQSGEVMGYENAIFSGLPTVEVARILKEYIIPNDSLNGLYHLSANPISKFDLLTLVALEYGKELDIKPMSTPQIDRSLDSTLFRSKTGFEPKSWAVMIKLMHERYEKTKK